MEVLQDVVRVSDVAPKRKTRIPDIKLICLTHKSGDWNANQFASTASNFENHAVLYDRDKIKQADLGQWGEFKEVYPFSQEEFTEWELFSPFQREPILSVGNAIAPVLYYAKEQGFPNLMVMEYDCVCLGNMQALADFCLRSDFVAPYYGGVSPTWMWKRCLRNPKGVMPSYNLYRSLNCFSYYSGQALGFLWDKYVEGWTGHYELLVATLLTKEGFNCRSPRNWYTMDTYHVGAPHSPDTMFQHGKLYHPVKASKDRAEGYGNWKPEFDPRSR